MSAPCQSEASVAGSASPAKVTRWAMPSRSASADRAWAWAGSRSALPTMVSVSEDALQATGRDMRMASYALGATRAETLVKVVIPAAASGILAAAILSIMRAIGETMVVWMASGNAARIPEPWYNLLEPVRTLTATIAGDMGEADQSAGSAHYHVLFAMALVLLLFSLACNMVSERMIASTRRRLR